MADSRTSHISAESRGWFRQFNRHPVHIMWWQRGMRRIVIGPFDLFYCHGYPGHPDSRGGTLLLGGLRLEVGNREWWVAHR
jgi:hypothetical protein